MMRQYRELKRRYPDYLLLFRLGDFYELFFEDAARRRPACCSSPSRRARRARGRSRWRASRTTPPTATSRGSSAPGRRSRCASRWRRPAKGKKLVRREVVRVITPGTITDTQFLDGAANNFLLAAAIARRRARSAWPSSTCPPATSGWARRPGAGDGAARGRAAAAARRAPACARDARRARVVARRVDALGVPVTTGEPGVASRRGPRARRSSPTSGAPALDAFGVGAHDGGPAGGGRRARLPRARRRASRSRTSRGSSGSCPAMRCSSTRPRSPRSSCSRRAHERSSRGSLVGALDATAHAHGRAPAPPVAAAPAARPRGHRARARRRWRPSSTHPAARDGPAPRACAAWATSSGSPAAPPSASAHARDLVGAARLPRPRCRRCARTSARLGGAAPRRRWPRTSPRRPRSASCWTRRSRTSRRSTLREGGLIREGWNAELREHQAVGARGAGLDRLASSSASASGRASPACASASTASSATRIEVSNAHAAQGARRVHPPPDPGRRRALRHGGAEGVREPRARGRGAHRAPRVRAVRRGARARSRRTPRSSCARRARWARSTSSPALAEVAHERGPRAAGGGRRPRARDRRRPPSGARGGRRAAVHAQRPRASTPTAARS